MEGAAVQKANAFASAADEYAEQGQLARAVEAHFRAAEQFLLATSYTSNADAVKTLKLLYANHTRQGKDLQRRLQQQQQSSSTSSTVPHQQQQPLLDNKRQPSTNAITMTSTPPTDVRSFDTTPQQQRQQPTRAVLATTSSDSSSSMPLQEQLLNVRRKQNQAPSPSKTTTPIYSRDPFNNNTSGPPQPYPEDMDVFGSRNFFVGQNMSNSITLPHKPNDNNTITSTTNHRHASHTTPQQLAKQPQNNRISDPATVAVESLDTSESSNLAHDSIDRSYFVLDSQQAEDFDEEPEDPFNKFWDVVENLVQKISISAPVAFTSLPLAGAPPSDVTTTLGNTSSSKVPNLMGAGGGNSNLMSGMPKGKSSSNATPPKIGASTMLNSYFVVPQGGMEASYLPQPQQSNLEEGFAEYVARRNVSSAAPIRRPASISGLGDVSKSKSYEELLVENNQMKQTVDYLSQRVAALEKAEGENVLLKSSIIQFRNDMQRKAARKPIRMSSSRNNSHTQQDNLAGSAVAPQESTVLNKSYEEENAFLRSRVATLEQEIQDVKSKYEAQLADLSKYRDRWEKLKESTKRKKESRAETGSNSDAASTKSGGLENMELPNSSLFPLSELESSPKQASSQMMSQTSSDADRRRISLSTSVNYNEPPYQVPMPRYSTAASSIQQRLSRGDAELAVQTTRASSNAPTNSVLSSGSGSNSMFYSFTQ